MRLLQEAADAVEKTPGSAFLYLSPKSPADQFAQCATCILFKPEGGRCAIFGPDDVVKAEASCGFYLHGKPSEDQECRSIVTPEQAGYVEEQVRCENCSWFDGECGFFRTLMEKMPDVFDLDPKVDRQGCCNGWSKA